MPDVAPSFRDELRGDVTAQTQIDDQVLLKSDGFPTYHSPRGRRSPHGDHPRLTARNSDPSTPSSDPYDALGWPPEWLHMPLLRNQRQSKISKRKNPVSLDYYPTPAFLPGSAPQLLGPDGVFIRWGVARS